jgi:hypothetical protein
MPRPTLDLQPFKGVITSWFHEGFSASNTLKRLCKTKMKVLSGVIVGTLSDYYMNTMLPAHLIRFEQRLKE